MTHDEYEKFDRLVEMIMKNSGDDWFTVEWSPMSYVCADKVAAGTLENRWNDQCMRVEYRAL